MYERVFEVNIWSRTSSFGYIGVEIFVVVVVDEVEN